MLRVFIFCCVAVSAANAAPKVVGGSKAILGQFPYQVRLKIGFGLCGGFVLDNRFIGTAAHCVENATPDDIKAKVGTINLISGGKTYKIIKIIIHPEYTSGNSDGVFLPNDIALLQTATEIAFTDNVKPVTLGDTFIDGGVTAIVSGFGKTSSNSSAAETLQFVKVKTITNEQCGGSNEVIEDQLCTSTRSFRGACVGDSGGPLVADRKVIGIVSSVGEVCAAGIPDTYTRISVYRDWILEHMNDESSH